MKKTKFFPMMLLLAMLAGLSFTLVACSDDDDDNKNAAAGKEGTDPYDKDSDEATALCRIVHLLAATDSLPDNWKTASYEPTEGDVLDASKPYVRSMAVSGADEALLFYSSLVGEDMAAGTATHTWQKNGVGSLHYTLLDQSDCYATLDVAMSNMPHLTQLRFVPAEATGDNGTFTGNAYYRIGDIVMDKDDRYWVCVRSAYSPKKKEDTHWASLQLLESEKKSDKTGNSGNLKVYAATSSRGKHTVPTKLGSDKRMIKYFAQLMYLLQKPDDYANNYAKGGVLENGLGDLTVDAHQNRYMKALAKYWNDHSIDTWSKVLPTGLTRNFFLQEKVNFLYEGYSSPIYTSNMSLSLCTQSGTCLSEQATKTVKWDMNGGRDRKFDILEYAHIGKAGENTNLPEGVMPQYAAVICLATGEQLNGGKSVKATEAIRADRVTEVFIANKTLPKADLGLPEEPIDDSMMKVGAIVGQNGKFYNSVDAARIDGTNPVAMVVYYNRNKLADSFGYRGLAIALKDYEGGAVEWVSPTGYERSYFGHCSITDIENGQSNQLATTLDGIGATDKMSRKLYDASHKHYPVMAVKSMKAIDNDDFSEWFLPSAGQWILALEGMGLQWDAANRQFKGSSTNHEAIIDKHFPITDATVPKGSYWTSSSSGSYAWAALLPEKRSYSLVLHSKSYDYRVRGFVAFAKTSKTEDKGFDAKADAKVGSIVGSDGRFYNNTTDAYLSGVKPQAFVVHAGEPGSVEAGSQYTHLAIALSDLPKEYVWAVEREQCAVEHYGTAEIAVKTINGLAETLRMGRDKCPVCKETHPAMKACLDLERLGPDSFSAWFLPSAGQMDMVFDSFEDKWSSNGYGTSFVKMDNFFNESGARGASLNQRYWTVSSHSFKESWILRCDGEGNGNHFYFVRTEKEGECCVRPFIAF